MKSHTAKLSRASSLLGAFALFLGPGVGTSCGQIFVSSFAGGTIGEYSTSGIPINPSLVSGLLFPTGIAVGGAGLFVAQWSINTGHSTVGQYTISGTVVSTSLISGLLYPQRLTISGNRLFVVDWNLPYISQYTTDGTLVNGYFIHGLNGSIAMTVSGGKIYIADSNRIGVYSMDGTAINASLITGLAAPPTGIAIDGNYIYVSEANNNGIQGRVAKYTIDGALVNGSLIGSFDDYSAIAVDGGALFVANYGNGTIGKYHLDGTVVNRTLISGVGATCMIVVPEPSSSVLAILGSVFLYLWRRGRFFRS
jgi:hypothetical protein